MIGILWYGLFFGSIENGIICNNSIMNYDVESLDN